MTTGAAPAGVPLLQVECVSAGYGLMPVLHEISIEVRRAEIVALVGSNGAGKTTLMRTLAGLLPARRGSILLAGKPIEALSPPDRLALRIERLRRQFRAEKAERANHLPKGKQ